MLGQTISHYRILSKLGHGGMGVVYEAEDVRLGRRVALKLLPENLTNDPTAFQRLQREARAACRLNHPNICTIYEIEEQDGRPVIVMELLEGESLKDRLGKSQIPLPEMLDLGIQVADALAAAQEVGIIHRDIKPANIFITQHGSAKIAKILDFGLAKLVLKAQSDARAAPVVDALDEPSLTEVGVIPGTASYMSPEQVKGEPLDARTDLFSLGTVLYEIFTGHQPFRRKTSILTLNAILQFRPKPPSRINPHLPAELDPIIAKALAKDRKDRYQTAAELRDALWRVKSSLPASHSSRFSYGNLASERAAANAEAASPARSTAPHAARRRYWKVVAPIILVASAVGIGVFFYSHRLSTLSEKDTIVLTDFDNKTGDPVFDETLRQALAVDLEQSPFLNVLSDRKMTATLRLMGRSPDQAVTGEVARELCQRAGSKAMLAGSIFHLGNHYVIGLNAVNCATGDSLVKQQIEAQGKDDVLKSLGDAAKDMRRKLGESLASVQKFATPIEEATTSSLEALKEYSTGRRAGYVKGDVAGIPYYERALELDPNFALAYRALAVAYINLGQSTRASENAKKAFDLRERVSEREKYAISSRYYSDVLGDLEKANQVYELWVQNYPRDFLPFLNEGDIYMRMGEWEKALHATQESLRLEPNSGVTNSNLAFTLLALNRTDEAAQTLDDAFARNMDFHFLRLARYEVAFLKGDQQAMQQQLAWGAGRPKEEDWLLSTQSDTEAYFGRLGEGRELARRAVESAQHADAKEAAALWQANSALREAELGKSTFARQTALAALALAPGRDVKCLVALALARAGDVVRARKLIEALNNDFAGNTIVQGYWLPAIRAAIEIEAKAPARAVQILQAATRYELAQCQPMQVGMMYPTYLRGEAFLLARQGREAGAEFQKVIDHRGLVVNFPLGALARLGLARALALQGDITKARTAYQDFLALWKSADPDIPILQQAKNEYAKLK